MRITKLRFTVSTLLLLIAAFALVIKLTYMPIIERHNSFLALARQPGISDVEFEKLELNDSMRYVPLKWFYSDLYENIGGLTVTISDKLTDDEIDQLASSLNRVESVGLVMIKGESTSAQTTKFLTQLNCNTDDCTIYTCLIDLNHFPLASRELSSLHFHKCILNFSEQKPVAINANSFSSYETVSVNGQHPIEFQLTSKSTHYNSINLELEKIEAPSITFALNLAGGTVMEFYNARGPNGSPVSMTIKGKANVVMLEATDHAKEKRRVQVDARELRADYVNLERWINFRHAPKASYLDELSKRIQEGKRPRAKLVAE